MPRTISLGWGVQRAAELRGASHPACPLLQGKVDMAPVWPGGGAGGKPPQPEGLTRHKKELLGPTQVICFPWSKKVIRAGRRPCQGPSTVPKGFHSQRREEMRGELQGPAGRQRSSGLGPLCPWDPHACQSQEQSWLTVHRG